MLKSTMLGKTIKETGAQPSVDSPPPVLPDRILQFQQYMDKAALSCRENKTFTTDQKELMLGALSEFRETTSACMTKIEELEKKLSVLEPIPGAETKQERIDQLLREVQGINQFRNDDQTRIQSLLDENGQLLGENNALKRRLINHGLDADVTEADFLYHDLDTLDVSPEVNPTSVPMPTNPASVEGDNQTVKINDPDNITRQKILQTEADHHWIESYLKKGPIKEAIAYFQEVIDHNVSWKADATDSIKMLNFLSEHFEDPSFLTLKKIDDERRQKTGK